jgi:diphthine-ammonia ligase
MRPRACISWSGGKDSCAALHRVQRELDVVSMITMFDEQAVRSRSHGLRPELLAAQAQRLGLTQFIGRATWETYSDVFQLLMQDVAGSGVTHVVFGDIMFDEWIASGADARIVTARAQFLDETWLGRTRAADMGPEFVRLGVDRCGERGEYHTVVTNTPLFSAPLDVTHGEIVQHGGCWALDLVVDA